MNPPFLFEPPQHWRSSILDSNWLPEGQSFRFADAYIIGKRWGIDSDQYLYHQLQEVQGIRMGIVSIQVKQFSLIRVRCLTNCCFLLYVLEGFSFVHLAGYGMLKLFSKTYSLQYLPADDHQLLLAPGLYHYLYILPGPLLSFLIQGHAAATRMAGYLNELYDKSYISAQLPLSNQIYKLLIELPFIENNTIKMAHRLRAILSDLILCFHQQTSNPIVFKTTADLHASMALFTANHLRWPVPAIISALCTNFFMQPSTLRQHWLRFVGCTPRKSLRQLRLYQAIYLLVVEKMSVATTADYLGFPHATHFSAQFLEQYKITPSRAPYLVAL